MANAAFTTLCHPNPSPAAPNGAAGVYTAYEPLQRAGRELVAAGRVRIVRRQGEALAAVRI